MGILFPQRKMYNNGFAQYIFSLLHCAIMNSWMVISCILVVMFLYGYTFSFILYLVCSLVYLETCLVLLVVIFVKHILLLVFVNSVNCCSYKASFAGLFEQ